MRLLLVDGHAYAYRSFHAIRGMKSPAGQPTGAVFGFIKALEKLRVLAGAEVGRRKSEAGPQASDFRVLVVWDGGLSAERMAVLPEYKAQRPEMPAELGEQIDGLQRYLSAAGVPWVCREGLEADDLIGTTAVRAAGAGVDVVVASADKDFMQLVADGTGAAGQTGWIGLLNPNDKSERIWGAAEVRVKAGVEPGQIVDWLALMGDAVDNIPGVPGVGAKTAAGLLNDFGSVDGIYGRLAEVKSPRLRAALLEAEVAVRRNVGLVRLRTDLAEAPGWAECAEGTLDRAALRGLFAGWGFRGMLAAVDGGGQRSEVGGQIADFGPRASAGRPEQSELL